MTAEKTVQQYCDENDIEPSAFDGSVSELARRMSSATGYAESSMRRAFARVRFHDELRQKLADYMRRERLDANTMARERSQCPAADIEAFLEGEPPTDKVRHEISGVLDRDGDSPDHHPGRVIRMTREALGWSRQRLVDESGVAYNTLKWIETMRSDEPSLSSLRPVGEVFAEALDGFEPTWVLLGSTDDVRQFLDSERGK